MDLINEDGSFEIPVLNIDDITNHLIRFQGSDYSFLSNELNYYRHYLPILSDPTMKDSDGDSFLDDKDPNPLISDKKIIKLDHSNYISIFDGTNNSFGGNQSWLGEFSDGRYCNGKIGAEHATKYGCGLIAGADVLLYLNKYNNLNMRNYAEVIGCNREFTTIVGNGLDLYEYAGYNGTTEMFDKSSYIQYLDLLSNKLTISDKIAPGVWPVFTHTSYNGVFKDVFNVCGLGYKASWNTSKSKEKCQKDIKQMLLKNIPVICAYYISDDEKNDEKELDLYEAVDSITFNPKKTARSHYMVITGIVEFSDDVLGITNHKIMYEISSWGEKYYIDAEEYLSNLSLFSNIFQIYG